MLDDVECLAADAHKNLRLDLTDVQNIDATLDDMPLDVP